MGLELTTEEQLLLADTFHRKSEAMTWRERLSALTAICALVVVSAAVWSARPPHTFDVLPAAISLVVLVLAAGVRFETPVGFTAPTDLAFVPLLFAVPLALVPPAVAVALVIRRVPTVLTRQMTPERLLNTIADAAFSLGPVIVFAIAGVRPVNAGAAVLVLALLALFAGDFLGTMMRDAIEGTASLSRQTRDSWIYGVDAALACVGLVIAEEMQRATVAALAPLPLLAVLATFARERHRHLEGLLELNNAYRGTALVLGDVVEADDGYTGEHCKSVVALCIEIAERLELDPLRRRNLEFGALLHDVGKIAIPKEIIHKPGKLDPQEWTLIKTHTIEGQKMLDRVGGFMREVGLIVRSHHERWDGAGYPDGVAAEAIPLEARIIACCDTWNAMRTDRPYRSALSYELAVEELLRAAGTQLDPKIVQTLIEVIEPESQSPGPIDTRSARSPATRDAAAAAGAT